MGPMTLPLLLALLLACDGGSNCADVSDPVQRENCWFDAISTAWVQDPEAATRAIREIGSVESRDLVRLRLAIDNPSRTALLCRDTETQAAQEKCKQVLGRPHLRAVPKPPEAAAPANHPPDERPVTP